MKEFSAAIIGGGISGLSLARLLIKEKNIPSQSLLLLEANNRLGGIIETYQRKGFEIEAAVDSISAGSRKTQEFLKSLNVFSQAKTVFPLMKRIGIRKENGEAYLFNKKILFLKYEGLTAREKIRAILGVFMARKRSNKESLADFFSSRFGEGFFKKIVKPIAEGLFMSPAEALAAEVCFANDFELNKSKASLFYNFTEGLETIVCAIRKEISQANVLLNSKAAAISKPRNQWIVETAGGEKFFSDKIFLAVPLRESAELLKNVDADICGEIEKITLQDIASVGMIFKKSDLPEPLRKRSVWVSANIGKSSFDSLKVLEYKNDEELLFLRAFVGSGFHGDGLKLNDSNLEREVLSEIKMKWGVLNNPLLTNIKRYEKVFPCYDIEYSARVNKIKNLLKRHQGLYMLGSRFGIAGCIGEAREIVQQI